MAAELIIIPDFMALINDFIIPIIIFLNICFAITVVFIERKNPTATIAWLMVLFFVPVLGFVLYLVFGQSFYRERMFTIKKEDDETLKNILKSQKKELFNAEVPVSGPISNYYRRMMLMLMESNKAPITTSNHVRVFVDGNDKFAALLEAIRGAKDHIHMEYYILKDDEIGNEVFTALTERASAGVSVRFLGDGLGCAKPRKRFYQPYLAAGGKLAFFFPKVIK